MSETDPIDAGIPRPPASPPPLPPPLPARLHDGPDANLAGRGLRLAGALIDGVLSLVILLPFMLGSGVFEQVQRGIQMTFEQQLTLFAIGWGVFLVLHGYLLLKRGQTIGKFLVKTKIVDLDGNLPPFGRLLALRYLALGLVAQLPVIGPLVSLADALFIFGTERRCLHDYLAGTRVINVWPSGELPPEVR